MDPNLKHAIDGVGVLAVAGTLAGYLPLVAAGLASLWYIIQIGEKAVKWYRRKQGYKTRATDK